MTSSQPAGRLGGKQRAFHTATLLSDDRVLIVGGNTKQNDKVGGGRETGGYFASCLLWEPKNQKWNKNVAALNAPRAKHAAVLLGDDQIVVLGGFCYPNLDMKWLSSAELWTPAANAWTEVASVPEARELVAGAPLDAERAVFVGGSRQAGTTQIGSAAVDVFDARHRTWSAGPQLPSGRWGHSAARLLDGTILVVGGRAGNRGLGDTLGEALRWDGHAAAWTAEAALVTARSGHEAVLLSDGQLLVVGGQRVGVSGELASAELRDPGSGAWREIVPMRTGRSGHAAVRLPDDRVLVVGGSGASSRSTELWDPRSDRWSAGPELSSARVCATATALRDGTVLVVGGVDDATAELLMP